MSLKLLGRKTVCDGQVTGDFCICSILDIGQSLMDKSLEICVFAVSWTKDRV